jgi:hypothetical protein
MLGASATTRMPRQPPARPVTIHGRRMPHRDAVRSLILPNNGLPSIASRAPTPATRAKLLGACLIPTSEFTFNGRVTSSGATNSRLVLMYANAYSEMKPHPTRCAAGGPGPSAALIAGRYLNPRRTEPSRAAGPANRTTREDMIRKAMVTPLGTVTRTILAVPPAHERSRHAPETQPGKAVRKPGPCLHRHQPSHRPQPLSIMAPAGDRPPSRPRSPPGGNAAVEATPASAARHGLDAPAAPAAASRTALAATQLIDGQGLQLALPAGAESNPLW